MGTLKWSKDDFESLLSELQSQIKDYNYNDGTGKLDSIEKYAKWSGETCGVDLRFFDEKIAPYVKFFLNDKHLERPLNDEEMAELDDNDFDGYKTFIDSDHLDNVCSLFCLAAEGLVQARKLIHGYYSRLEKLQNIIDGNFDDNDEE